MIIFTWCVGSVSLALLLYALAEEPAFRGWVARRAKWLYEMNKDFENLSWGVNDANAD
mgnify:CR=1 FL=1